MFNNENLDMMAEAAKRNLQKQAINESVQEEASGDDIYAEFRSEQEVVVSDNYTETISSQPTSNEYEHPPINNIPDDGYYMEYPDYSIDPSSLVTIFEGGPTKAHLDSWKKQFDGYGIFVVEVEGEKFVFRTLNRFEYKQIVSLQNIDALQREEIICETVTLWPQQYTWDTMATGRAGLPSTYAEIIMGKSGFTKEYSIQVL